MAYAYRTPHLNKKAGGFGSIVDALARGRAVDLLSSYQSTTGTAFETADHFLGKAGQRGWQQRVSKAAIAAQRGNLISIAAYVAGND